MADLTNWAYIKAALATVLLFSLAAGLVSSTPWRRALCGFGMGYGLCALALAAKIDLAIRLLPLFIASGLLSLGLLTLAHRVTMASAAPGRLPLAIHWRGEVSVPRATLNIGLGAAFFMTLGAGLDSGPDHPLPRILAGALALVWLAGTVGVALLVVGAWRATREASDAMKVAGRMVLVLLALVSAFVVVEIGVPHAVAQAAVALGGGAPPVGTGWKVSPRSAAELSKVAMPGMELVPTQQQPPPHEAAREGLMWAAKTSDGIIGLVMIFRFEPPRPLGTWDAMYEGFSKSWAIRVERVLERPFGQRTFRYGRVKSTSTPYREALWFRAYGDVTVAIRAPSEEAALFIAETLATGWGQ